MLICADCGHANRPGVVFCENCGTSLTGLPGAGSTKGIAPTDSSAAEQVADAGTDYLAPGVVLRLEIEGGPEPILIPPRQELIFGRRDPATGAMPDIDLTPYAGYRMGVSRRHAALRLTDEHHLDVWDLGSSNGTFLNGVRLNPHRPYRMRDGDRVRLGQMVIRVLFNPPEAVPADSTAATVPSSRAATLAAAFAEVSAHVETRSAEEIDVAIARAMEQGVTERVDLVERPAAPAPHDPAEGQALITELFNNQPVVEASAGEVVPAALETLTPAQPPAAAEAAGAPDVPPAPETVAEPAAAESPVAETAAAPQVPAASETTEEPAAADPPASEAAGEPAAESPATETAAAPEVPAGSETAEEPAAADPPADEDTPHSAAR